MHPSQPLVAGRRWEHGGTPSQQTTTSPPCPCSISGQLPSPNGRTHSGRWLMFTEDSREPLGALLFIKSRKPCLNIMSRVWHRPTDPKQTASLNLEKLGVLPALTRRLKVSDNCSVFGCFWGDVCLFFQEGPEFWRRGQHWPREPSILWMVKTEVMGFVPGWALCTRQGPQLG